MIHRKCPLTANSVLSRITRNSGPGRIPGKEKIWYFIGSEEILSSVCRYHFRGARSVTEWIYEGGVMRIWKLVGKVGYSLRQGWSALARMIGWREKPALNLMQNVAERCYTTPRGPEILRDGRIGGGMGCKNGYQSGYRRACLWSVQWRLVRHGERNGFCDLLSQVWNEAF